MKDLLLDKDGDLYIKEEYGTDRQGNVYLKSSDVVTVDSIAQAIKIRLQWFFNEWIFNPEYGVKYFEYFFVKNPSKVLIISSLNQQILAVDGVDSVRDIEIDIDGKTRSAKITYEAVIGEDALREEVEIWSMV